MKYCAIAFVAAFLVICVQADELAETMAAALLSALATPVLPSWVTDCTGGNALFRLSSIKANPDPPVIGKNITLDMSGVLMEDVTAGTSL